MKTWVLLNPFAKIIYKYNFPEYSKSHRQLWERGYEVRGYRGKWITLFYLQF